jgi:hypothetical protein
VDPKPPMLWIRGTEDVIVSDTPRRLSHRRVRLAG